MCKKTFDIHFCNYRYLNLNITIKYKVLKTRIISILLLLTLISGTSLSQEQKHIIGFSYGFQYKDGDIWIGDPFDLWIDQTSSTIFEGFYYYRLSSLFQAGFYCDYEAGKFDVTGISEQLARRIGFGTIWLGHYPDKLIQFQLGGYFGYNTASIDYDDFGNRGGIDYGIIAGPAIEYRNLGIAIHHHSGFSWYPKDAEPDEFSYANSKIKIKLYYKF
jgi:hypothetical protein